ncbi:MAG: hypothetical protein Q4E56_05260 [Pseudomonadota bacterium]|nr:hypothetical protein [Pseudomonadota bacterium]
MLKQKIKYFFTTSAAQRRADRQRYRELQRDLEKLNADVQRSWYQISIDVPANVDIHKIGDWCMKNRNLTSDDLPSVLRLFSYNFACKYFDENACCGNRGCAIYAKNKQHFDILAQRNLARARMDSYWHDIYTKER